MSAVSDDKGPIPLDPFGNQVCLLFLKYGKCRYKKKCKHSHILPDKDAFMQQVIPTTVEQPVAKSGPKISFPIRKTPYARPLPQSDASNEPPTKKPRQFSSSTHQRAIQHDTTHQGTDTAGKETGHDDLNHQRIDHHDEEMIGPEIDHTLSLEPPKAVDTIATTTATSDDHEMRPTTQQDDEKSKSKPKKKSKRPAKTQSKCLLSFLFTSTISDFAYQQPSVNTFVVGQPASRTPARGKKAAGPASGQKDRSGTSSHSTNEAAVSGEKVEQWYITNKAYLDPESRRLMVQTKPTTVRQVNQLKTMRKHHWECHTEVVHQLRKNTPGTYSLKIARTRIDWERVEPYVTLMIQAEQHFVRSWSTRDWAE
ncbi:MAG: hypothetical protein J3Q66DRAFT_369228 [Benniella sp.]|nr:MAG: hypothetical protein J3Q66DRAFT_369228 [Benniella sp.]